jgi:magnesium transporter
VITVLILEHGQVRRETAVDPAWLRPGAPVVFWVDIPQAAPDAAHLLRDVFGFHELAIEDALSEVHHPKIEHYEKFLYLILHGIAAGQGQRGFATQDVDFFLGPNYLVTVHGQASRSITHLQEICVRHSAVLSEGPPGLLHRIVDTMVDHYRPEVDLLEERLDALERVVFEEPRTNPLRDILALKQDVASLRRITLPERDSVGRLARREFPEIPDALAYQFRDVYDHLVNLTDEAVSLQDRVSGLLDAYLSSQSNRLNQVMKVLTVIATIFMPLTVLTGMWGMNVGLPHLPGGDGAQFWWVAGIMGLSSGGMLAVFRKLGWL